MNAPPSRPNPGDTYSVEREGLHIDSSADTQTQLGALIEVLAQFQPTDILDALGNKFKVLAYPEGGQAPIIGSSSVGLWGAGITFQQLTGGDWQFMVYAKSRIGTSPADADQITVSNVGEWIDFTSSDTSAVLSGVVADLITSEVTLSTASSSPGGIWLTDGFLVGDGSTPQVQNAWNLEIAKFDWTSGSPVLQPVVVTNLMLFIGSFSDSGGDVSPANYPAPA